MQKAEFSGKQNALSPHSSPHPQIPLTMFFLLLVLSDNFYSVIPTVFAARTFWKRIYLSFKRTRVWRFISQQKWKLRPQKKRKTQKNPPTQKHQCKKTPKTSHLPKKPNKTPNTLPGASVPPSQNNQYSWPPLWGALQPARSKVPSSRSDSLLQMNRWTNSKQFILLDWSCKSLG